MSHEHAPERTCDACGTVAPARTRACPVCLTPFAAPVPRAEPIGYASDDRADDDQFGLAKILLWVVVWPKTAVAALVARVAMSTLPRSLAEAGLWYLGNLGIVALLFWVVGAVPWMLGFLVIGAVLIEATYFAVVGSMMGEHGGGFALFFVVFLHLGGLVNFVTLAVLVPIFAAFPQSSALPLVTTMLGFWRLIVYLLATMEACAVSARNAFILVIAVGALMRFVIRALA